MSFVTLTDFTTRYGNTVPIADVVRVDALLSDACALVTDIIDNDYIDLLGVPEPVPGAILAVVTTAVGRAYDNPMGLSMEVTGGHTWMQTQKGTGVYFTSAEIRIIRRAAGKLGAGTLTMVGLLSGDTGSVT